MHAQSRPPRGRKTSLEEAPRIATIHEYLDWTVTAEDALGERDLVRAARLFWLLLEGAWLPCLFASVVLMWGWLTGLEYACMHAAMQPRGTAPPPAECSLHGSLLLL
jgi:hypothetical protein